MGVQEFLLGFLLDEQWVGVQGFKSRDSRVKGPGIQGRVGVQGFKRGIQGNPYLCRHPYLCRRAPGAESRVCKSAWDARVGAENVKSPSAFEGAMRTAAAHGAFF